MEVARTSMYHAGAPQFLWPQAVRYTVHQLNLWPSDARPRVTPVSLWTGVSHVTPRSSPLQHPVLVVSGGVGGVAAEGVGTGAAGARGAGSGGAGGVRLETTPEEDTAVSTLWPRPASPLGFLSVPEFPPCLPLRPVAAEPGSVAVGGTGFPGMLSVEVLVLGVLELETRALRRLHYVLRGVTATVAGAAASTAREGRGGVTTAAAGAVEATRESRRREEAEQQRLKDLPNAAPTHLVRGPLPSPPVPPVEPHASSPWARHSHVGHAVSPEPRRSRYHADGPFHLVLRSRVPPPPVLPQPPESSLIVFHNPFSDYLHAFCPIVSHVLSTLVTHPIAPLSSVSALVTTVAGFASSHRASHLVSGTARFPSTWGCSCYSPGGPGGQALRRQRWHLIGPLTYVDAVLPPGTNAVSGMLLYKVKRPPGSPPVFKARYVVRGFRQCEGVDFFQTFAPTPKMTTLQVLLHIAAQRDYELHSLDFSRAFLHGEPTREDLAASFAWLHWLFPTWDPVAAASTGLRPAINSPGKGSKRQGKGGGAGGGGGGDPGSGGGGDEPGPSQSRGRGPEGDPWQVGPMGGSDGVASWYATTVAQQERRPQQQQPHQGQPQQQG
ncbi:unnamed protein product [Closterium sp. NIES-54]